jgi:uncharacterized membrane protein
MIIFWILILVALYFVFKDRIDFHVSEKKESESSAEEKLKIRFVNGEIDEDTYLRMKEVLKS